MQRMCTDLVREIVKHRLIPPPFHLAALESRKLLELCLLRVFVESCEEFFEQDEVFPSCLVKDLDVVKVWMYAERKIAGQCPRGGRPCEEGCFRVVDEGEGDSHYSRRKSSAMSTCKLCSERTCGIADITVI